MACVQRNTKIQSKIGQEIAKQNTLFRNAVKKRHWERLVQVKTLQNRKLSCNLPAKSEAHCPFFGLCITGRYCFAGGILVFRLPTTAAD